MNRILAVMVGLGISMLAFGDEVAPDAGTRPNVQHKVGGNTKSPHRKAPIADGGTVTPVVK